MVTVNFKLQDRESVKLAVDQPQRLEQILARCSDQSAIAWGGFIAVRNNAIITGSDWVEDLDEIDIFPALSGG